MSPKNMSAKKTPPQKTPDKPHKSSPYVTSLLIGSLLFGGAYGVGYLVLQLDAIIAYAIAASLAAFMLCWYDKWIAHTNKTRVPELVLLGMAFVGGTPGLLLGMLGFKHKTTKTSFQIGLAIVIVVQGLIFRELRK